ncbi:MAG: glycosyltransferase family 4 protein [Anaerolineae bacterium]|nr:glycosyltransferase family 4 protein [Anaerolineae bacterium]
MRLLYLSRGLTMHDLRFITSLLSAGVAVKWLRLGADAGFETELPSSALLEVIRWVGDTRDHPLDELPSLVPALQAVIRQTQPDILHAGPIQNCAYLAALSGFQPMVALSFGYDLLMDAGSSPQMAAATRTVLQKTTILFVDCDAVRQKAVELGFSGRPVVQFPWGVDLVRFSPGDGDAIRRRLGWQDDFIFLSLRALEPLYGVDVVVRGFLQAAQRDSSIRLVLLGSGSLESGLRRMVSESDCAERAHFGGRVINPDLPAWYRAADCYVSASHTDGSSVSLMEALACAKPVLVSDIPGNREWVEEGGQGWRFEDGDAGALAERMLAIAAHPRLQVIGAAARRRAEEKADWDVNFKTMLNGYRQALRFASPWTVS